jgi:hypothetical protein
MQMYIEIGGRAKALDEGHGAGLGLMSCQTGVCVHKGGEGTVDVLQQLSEKPDTKPRSNSPSRIATASSGLIGFRTSQKL